TATLHVTSPAGATAGTYQLGVSATRTGNPSDAASAAMTYTVVAPGAGGSFTDDFNRIDLGPNWQVLQGSAFSIVNNELRNGAIAGLHRAVVAGLAGATQTVTAKFASTNQNSGVPTFGFMLRYQDPSNYYFLYRQAGGTSVLRIARVVNGIATVLAS